MSDDNLEISPNDIIIPGFDIAAGLFNELIINILTQRGLNTYYSNDARDRELLHLLSIISTHKIVTCQTFIISLRELINKNDDATIYFAMLYFYRAIYPLRKDPDNNDITKALFVTVDDARILFLMCTIIAMKYVDDDVPKQSVLAGWCFIPSNLFDQLEILVCDRLQWRCGIINQNNYRMVEQFALYINRLYALKTFISDGRNVTVPEITNRRIEIENIITAIHDLRVA